MISQFETNIDPNREPVSPRTEPLPKLRNRDLFRRDNYFTEDQVGFHSGSQKRTGMKLALWSWMSAMIDSLILTSISCFTMILLSVLLKSGNFDILKYMFSDLNLMEIFTVIFLFSAWTYLITMRIFMGATLGEWSCQLRLGQPVQRIQATYILKVIARTTLILSTGVITLPILSLLLKRDLTGGLTGVKIYSLV